MGNERTGSTYRNGVMNITITLKDVLGLFLEGRC